MHIVHGWDKQPVAVVGHRIRREVLWQFAIDTLHLAVADGYITMGYHLESVTPGGKDDVCAINLYIVSRIFAHLVSSFPVEKVLRPCSPSPSS